MLWRECKRMNGVPTNQQSRETIRTNFNYCSIFTWRFNYSNKELPLIGSECPKISPNRVNDVPINQESYQNWELTLVLVSFHLVLYLHTLMAPTIENNCPNWVHRNGRCGYKSRTLLNSRTSFNSHFLFHLGRTCPSKDVPKKENTNDLK